MSNNYAILPCNGLDKCAGCVSREVAIKLSENNESEIICPVLFRVADALSIFSIFFANLSGTSIWK